MIRKMMRELLNKMPRDSLFSCLKDSTYQQYNTGFHCNLTEPIFFSQKFVTFDSSQTIQRKVECIQLSTP